MSTSPAAVGSELPPERRQFLSISLAAQNSSLSQRTIRRLIKTGKLPSYRPSPRRIVVDRNELDQVIRSTIGLQVGASSEKGGR